MIRKVKVLNMYSDLDTDIDIIVVLHREEQTEQAEYIMTKAHDDWFNMENKENITFTDYLKSQLKQARIEFDLYINKEY